MAPTHTTHEADVRAFAAKYGHLPNVQRMIALAEAGTITWAQAHQVASQALAAGLASVCGCTTALSGGTYTQTAWPYATLPNTHAVPCQAHTPAWQHPGFTPGPIATPVHEDWERRLLASIR